MEHPREALRDLHRTRRVALEEGAITKQREILLSAGTEAVRRAADDMYGVEQETLTAGVLALRLAGGGCIFVLVGVLLLLLL